MTIVPHLVYSSSQRRCTYGSILHEVSGQEGNEEPEESDHEEWQTGNKWCLFQVRHKDVPNWEGLEFAIHKNKGIQQPGFSRGARLFVLRTHIYYYIAHRKPSNQPNSKPSTSQIQDWFCSWVQPDGRGGLKRFCVALPSAKNSPFPGPSPRCRVLQITSSVKSWEFEHHPASRITNSNSPQMSANSNFAKDTRRLRNRLPVALIAFYYLNYSFLIGFKCYDQKSTDILLKPAVYGIKAFEI